MINRRQVLGGLLSLPLFGFTKPKGLVHPVIGKVTDFRYQCNYSPEFMMEIGASAYYKYVTFPVELSVTLNGEDASATFVCWNPTEKSLAELRELKNIKQFVRKARIDFDSKFNSDLIVKLSDQELSFKISHIVFHKELKDDPH